MYRAVLSSWFVPLCVVCLTLSACSRPPGDDTVYANARSDVVLDAAFSFGSEATPLRVRVNGRGPYRLGFDSAASVPLMLEPRIVEELGLPMEDRYRASAGEGPGGVDAMGTTVDSLEIQGLSLEHVETIVLEGAEPDKRDGTLGFPLFEGLLLTLDLKGSRLVARRGELVKSQDQLILPYELERGLPVVSITLGALTLDAGIDTGSGSGLMLPPSFIDRLPLAAEPEVVGRIATLFNETDLLSATLDGVLTIGPHRIERPTVYFAEIVGQPNLGRKVLGEFSLTFDQRHRLVRFDRPHHPVDFVEAGAHDE